MGGAEKKLSGEKKETRKERGREEGREGFVGSMFYLGKYYQNSQDEKTRRESRECQVVVGGGR